jgi:hypothetical protein
MMWRNKQETTKNLDKCSLKANELLKTSTVQLMVVVQNDNR